MTDDSVNTIIDYRRSLNQMLDELKRLRNYAYDLRLTDAKEHAQNTLERIENKFFTIAVVGEFNRGKSTLINALLGEKILPQDILPCSATLNRVTYGPKPYASLIFKPNDGEPSKVEDISVNSLADYVTKLTPESTAKAELIKEAIIYHPTPYCRNKADIVDTPGLNDDKRMTEVTLSVLPKTDAAIMVMIGHAPFSETESNFLNNRMLTTDIGRVLFVINCIDQVDPEDRERVKKGISLRIKESVKRRAAELYPDHDKVPKHKEEYEMFVKRIGEPKIFSVSAKQALKAKLDGGNKDLLEESGFPVFESGLEHFLTHDRGNVEVQVLADCMVNISSKILHKLSLQESALSLQQQEFETAYSLSLSELEELRRKYFSEMEKVDQAKKLTYSYTYNILAQLELEIKQAANKAIETIKIEPSDISKTKVEGTQKKLLSKIEENIQKAIYILSDRTQIEIERSLRNEIDRLQEFAGEVKSTMTRIELNFRQIQLEAKTEDVGVDIVVGSALGMLPLPIGGIFTGYREAGLKGAVVGGIAGLGAAFSTAIAEGILIGLLGLPFTWPVILVVGITGGVMSALGGKWVTSIVFGQDKVEEFKQNFKKAFLSKVDSEIGNIKLDLDHQLNKQVNEAFDVLKNKVHIELGSLIEETQKTLDELKSDLTRSKTEKEKDLGLISAIRSDTEKIQSKALAKSNELRAITSV